MANPFIVMHNIHVSLFVNDKCITKLKLTSSCYNKSTSQILKQPKMKLTANNNISHHAYKQNEANDKTNSIQVQLNRF